MGRVEGKVVVVNDGAGGQGVAEAEALARDEMFVDNPRRFLSQAG
jgi:hypothetical protein